MAAALASIGTVTIGVAAATVPGAAPAAATPPPATLEAWIYPASAGQPACDTGAELAALDADPVSVLKPEYLTVGSRGQVLTETAAELPCNGFSAANLAAVRRAARSVDVTVSAGTRATKALLANAGRRAAARTAIAAFVAANGLDGVDLDFEPTRWTAPLWSSYLTFVSALSSTMRTGGRIVDVDLEPFTTTPWDAERYGAAAGAGARVVVMAYDNEFDAPCAAITPLSWLEQVVAYAQSQVPAADLTIGIPSYGYTTTTCRRVAHVTSNVAYVTMEHDPGFPATPAAVAADRDPGSDELRWSSGGVFHDVVDATALNAKLQVAEEMGVTDVSVWSLGGEPWFS
ncbi:MAG TPA: glycosyl hydrolase family 18 protein, partial [Acidimicrobiales bacterium]|nr:glycosyl hydrolase family 18 protein [Acidimicrobiales bacterium]